MNKFFIQYRRYLAVFISFAAAVAIFYGSTLENGFVFDDHGVIETNIYIQSFKYLPKVISGCSWESYTGSCKNTDDYRPLRSLSNLLTYQISPKPWAFHLVNLIYFTVAVFLIFIFTELLTGNFFTSLIAGLIFLIHPINSEVVNWVSTPDLLQTIFALLAVIFHFLYRKERKSGNLIFVYLFYTLSFLAKEPSVFLPVIFLTLDLTFFKQKISSYLNWKNIKPYIVFFVIFTVYLGIRFWVMGGIGGAAGATHTFTPTQRIYMFFYLFSLYIQKLFWPYPLNFYYDYPPSFNFLSINFLKAFVIVAGFAGLMFTALKKHRNIMLFALIWLFVFLLPCLVFLNSLVVIFAERYLIVPSIGFAILVATLLGRLWKKGQKERTAVVIFLTLISLVSFAIIHQRNMYWKSDVIIYQNELKNSPDSIDFRYNLAMSYWNEGDTASAKKEFGQIIKIGSGDNLARSYNNLGDIYRREGNYDEALRYFEAAIKINPNHQKAYNNIGALSLEKGDILGSVTNLCKALLIDSNFKDANNNFNIAASKIQGLDNRAFMSLYGQILQGNIFKPGKANITLKNMDCSSYPQGCLLIFSSTLPKQEFLFPFLIVGKTDSGEVVRNRYFEFNPQTLEIAIGIDRQFGGQNIHFWFPGCNGMIYETGSI